MIIICDELKIKSIEETARKAGEVRNELQDLVHKVDKINDKLIRLL